MRFFCCFCWIKTNWYVPELLCLFKNVNDNFSEYLPHSDMTFFFVLIKYVDNVFNGYLIK